MQSTPSSLGCSIPRRVARNSVWCRSSSKDHDLWVLQVKQMQFSQFFMQVQAELTTHFRLLKRQDKFDTTLTATQKILIYMIHCRRCDKQYKNETKRRRPVDRPTSSSRQTTVPEHFTSNNHTPHDMELIPIGTHPHISWLHTQSPRSVSNRQGLNTWTQRYQQQRRIVNNIYL